MDVLHALYETLAAFGMPVYLQGSMSDDEPYPEAFYTYFNNISTGAMYYDDSENAVIWDFDVNAYATNPDTAQAMIIQARDALRALGYVCAGAGYDTISDEPTHIGRGINATYLERVVQDGQG